MAIEFGERIRRIPSYPLAAGYDLGADVAMLASNESFLAPRRGVAAGGAAALTGVHRYPDPSYAALRGALSERYGIPRQRIALGNGSCDILLAAGEALLEPGAEVVYAWPAFSVYPHLAAASGARAIEVPLDAEDRHDLDAIATEITVATRLVLICNPNNPTSTALALDAIEEFLRARPAPRVRDPRRGLLRVRARARRHVRVARPAATVAQPRAAADLLEGLRARRACGSATGCAASEDFRAAVDQVRQPFYLNAAAQAAAVEALRHQDEVERRVTRTVAGRGWSCPTACASSACGSQTRTPTSSGRTCPRTVERQTWSRAGRSAACSSAPEPRSGARGRCGSRSAPTAENERFLAAIAAAGLIAAHLPCARRAPVWYNLKPRV